MLPSEISYKGCLSGQIRKKILSSSRKWLSKVLTIFFRFPKVKISFYSSLVKHIEKLKQKYGFELNSTLLDSLLLLQSCISLRIQSEKINKRNLIPTFWTLFKIIFNLFQQSGLGFDEFKEFFAAEFNVVFD